MTYGEDSGLFRVDIPPETERPTREVVRPVVEIVSDPTGKLCRWGPGPKNRCPFLQTDMDRCVLFGDLSKAEQIGDRGQLYFARHERCLRNAASTKAEQHG